MQLLEVSGALQLIYKSLGVKRLKHKYKQNKSHNLSLWRWHFAFYV